MRQSYAIILFILAVSIVVALSPEEEAFWQDPQYVASLSNDEFFKAIKYAPELLANEYVFASIDVRLSDVRVVEYINRDEKLLSDWGKNKGIEFDPGAGFTKYEKGYITTKGKGIVFKPEDMLGARVLNDGSVVFGSARIEEGKAAKSVADEVMVQGTVVDTRTKTRFTATGFNIALGIDMYSIRETVAITTQYGTYTVRSKNRFNVGFDGENPSVSGTNVEIVPEQDDNAFTLEKGSAILYDNERFGLDANTRIQFGDTLTGTDTDAFVVTAFAVTNTIKVDKPSHFCFTECNGIDQVVPDAYAISSIEVLRNRKFGDNEPVDRLKITARDTTNIDVNLQNPEYESVYADAHRGGMITLVQHGKNVVVEEATATSHDGGYPTVEYYSEAVISPDVEGGVKVKGDGMREDVKSIGGNTLLIPDKDIAFSNDGILLRGTIKVFEFQRDFSLREIVSVIVPSQRLTAFNLKEYHAGKPLGNMAIMIQPLENFYFPASSPLESEESPEQQRQRRIDEYRTAARTGQTLDVRDVADMSLLEELTPDERRELIKNAFEGYTSGRTRTEHFTRLHDYARRLFDDGFMEIDQYDQIRKDMLRWYVQEGSAGMAMELLRNTPSRVFSPAERDSAQRLYDNLRSLPPNIVTEDISHYKTGDVNADSIIDTEEARVAYQLFEWNIKTGPYEIRNE